MDTSSLISILTVDDHDLVRKGIAAILSTEPDLRLVGEANTAADALRLYRQFRPDVTLMDLRLPDLSGIDATIAIRTEFPQARVIILSTFGGETEVLSVWGAFSQSTMSCWASL